MVGMKRSAWVLVAAVAVAAGWAAPPAASAQDIPSYAAPATVSTDETIHGRIRSVDGAFTIAVADDRGFVDTVSLHPGTIINPTGLTLSPGMSVTILGYNAGAAFSANEIDTPYTYSGPLPTPVYYGTGYWYPGFAYGYGPSFGLAIVFGGGGYDGPWHYEHCGFGGRPWNGHAYFGNVVGAVPLVRGNARYAPGERATPFSHVPPAFAGRMFAGETRARGSSEVGRSAQVFSSDSNREAGRPSDERAPRGGYEGARGGYEGARGGYAPSAPVHGGSFGGGSRGSAPSHGSTGRTH